MNQYAMRFAVIRFMPYVQTREFANIGIIITHPKSGYFDFKIEQRYSRLSRFSAASIRPSIKRRPVPLQKNYSGLETWRHTPRPIRYAPCSTI